MQGGRKREKETPQLNDADSGCKFPLWQNQTRKRKVGFFAPFFFPLQPPPIVGKAYSGYLFFFFLLLLLFTQSGGEILEQPC